MAEEPSAIGRRRFLKTVGVLGVSSILASADALGAEGRAGKIKEQKSELPQVPRRKLGKTGVEVSCLALGTIFDVMEKQTVLRNAVKWGVTYWDTAPDYAGPNSELGIGKFIAANPDIRKKLFISTKASDAVTIADIEKALQASLKRLNTDYICLLYTSPSPRD